MEGSVESTIERLNAKLPEEFEFYHLGKIARATEKPDSTDPQTELELGNSSYFAFQMIGDAVGVNATLLISFPKNLDLSIYSEVGNILASQLASKVGFMTSPPIYLKSEQAARIIENARGSLLRREYFHLYDRLTLSLHFYILIEPQRVTPDV